MKTVIRALTSVIKKKKADLFFDSYEHAVFITNCSLPKPSQSNAFLISPRIAVTAKHCVDDRDLSKHRFSCKGRSSRASKVFVDPEHDIALVLLEEPLSKKFATIAAQHSNDDTVLCGGTIIEEDMSALFKISCRYTEDKGVIERTTVIEGQENLLLFKGFSKVRAGFSGAAIYNNHGEVIAMLTGLAILEGNEKLISAIPYDVLRDSIKRLSLELIG